MLITSFVSLALTCSPLAKAEPPTDRDVLLACDRANGTCQGALAAKDTLIRQQDEQIGVLSKENSALRNRGTSILDAPLTFYILGVLTTALTIHLVK